MILDMAIPCRNKDLFYATIEKLEMVRSFDPRILIQFCFPEVLPSITASDLQADCPVVLSPQWSAESAEFQNEAVIRTRIAQ